MLKISSFILGVSASLALAGAVHAECSEDAEVSAGRAAVFAAQAKINPISEVKGEREQIIYVDHCERTDDGLHVAFHYDFQSASGAAWVEGSGAFDAAGKPIKLKLSKVSTNLLRAAAQKSSEGAALLGG